MEKRKIRVAAAVIENEGVYFAAQRGGGAYKDGWEFPGGKIEAGESPAEAAVREIAEEFGAEIEAGPEIAVIVTEYPEYFVELHVLLCGLKRGPLNLREHEDSRWLKPAEIDSVAWLPADRKAVEELKKLWKKWDAIPWD